MARWLKPAELHDLAVARWGHQSEWRCVYCGRNAPDGAVDHFIPRERGGTDLPWNLVPACGPCNRSKSDLAPLAWMQAVGVPDATIAALQTVTTAPDWRKGSTGYRYPRFVALDYAAAFGLSHFSPRQALPKNLAKVFVMDPDAWAPATALRRIAADYLDAHDQPPLSTQQLNKLLESRGLARTKRRGVYGYRGFHVSPDTAAAGRFAAGRTTAAASRRAARKQAAWEFERRLTEDPTSGRYLG